MNKIRKTVMAAVTAAAELRWSQGFGYSLQIVVPHGTYYYTPPPSSDGLVEYSPKTAEYGAKKKVVAKNVKSAKAALVAVNAHHAKMMSSGKK